MAASVKLDDDMKDRVRALAEQQQRSPHWIMREAIRQYVEREEVRASFAQEEREGWEEYRRTGLHLTLDEVNAWLETWGTPDEKGPPECHL